MSTMNIPFKRGIVGLLVCALGAPLAAFAQADTAMPLPSASQTSAPLFSQQQLDQMLAPVALYPDALLAQVLMAATYPTDVVEAASWAQQNPGLTGAALQDALQGQPWDPSVKSLCAFPTVLERMSEGLAWTQELGDAFVDQQQQVMDTVQGLRRKARAAGTLASGPQQIVALDNNTITIAPADPRVVYVPTYDPAFAYGSWWWADYPPYYPSYWGPTLGAGFFWGAGIFAGAALWGGFDWRHHEVHRDLGRFNQFNRAHIVDSQWHHDLAHRGLAFGGDPFRGPQLHGEDRFGASRGATMMPEVGVRHEGEIGREGGFGHEDGIAHEAGFGHEGEVGHAGGFSPEGGGFHGGGMGGHAGGGGHR
jgi:uncharacterized membrane protein YgcG